MAEREPIGWYTRGGKHIPVFDDGPTSDEKKKDREIAENKKQADEKNGKSTVYKVYRSGKTNFKDDDYPVFFAEDESYAREYSKDKNGKDREFGEYELELRNPYIVEVKATESKTWDEKQETYYYHNEQAGPITAYNKIFGTKYDHTKNNGVDEFLNWETAKSKRVKMQQQRDREMLNEVRKQGYDSIIYKFDRPMNGSNGIKWSDGRTKSKNEIIVPAGMLKKKKKEQ